MKGKYGNCRENDPHARIEVTACVCVHERHLFPLPKHKAMGPNRKLHTLLYDPSVSRPPKPKLHTNILPE